MRLLVNKSKLTRTVLIEKIPLLIVQYRSLRDLEKPVVQVRKIYSEDDLKSIMFSEGKRLSSYPSYNHIDYYCILKTFKGKHTGCVIRKDRCIILKQI